MGSTGEDYREIEHKKSNPASRKRGTDLTDKNERVDAQGRPYHLLDPTGVKVNNQPQGLHGSVHHRPRSWRLQLSDLLRLVPLRLASERCVLMATQHRSGHVLIWLDTRLMNGHAFSETGWLGDFADYILSDCSFIACSASMNSIKSHRVLRSLFATSSISPVFWRLAQCIFTQSSRDT